MVELVADLRLLLLMLLLFAGLVRISGRCTG